MLNREDAVELAKSFNVDIRVAGVNEIYDYFEPLLMEKDREIKRLRSQISRGHDSKCVCSFCNPHYEMGI